MIVQGITNSFKSQILQGVHDLLTDTLKIALYTANASLNLDTTIYSATNEVTGSGYSAGGETVLNVTINQDGNTEYVSFDNVTYNAAITARCALLYNASKGNKAIAVLDFGDDKTSSHTFTVQLPANTSTNALIRMIN